MNHYFTDNDNLRSELRTVHYSFQNYNFSFYTDLGVFSKAKIDEGSKTLVETYFIHGRKNIKVLDAGCGYGFVGITLAKVMNCDVDFIDINKRAVHLCNMNLKENKVNGNEFVSNVYENVKAKYDLIIVNPPIKAGKTVYLRFIHEAFEHLNENGELWFVMKTNHGVKTVYKNLVKSHKAEVLAKNKGFYVIFCKNQLTH